MDISDLSFVLHRIFGFAKSQIIHVALLFTSFFAFAQVDVVGSEKIFININGSSLKIPYFSNHDLSVQNMSIKYFVLVVHGANRDADVYYNNMMTAASLSSVDMDSVLIIAPQFLTDLDIDSHNLDNEHLYWTDGGWSDGSVSLNEITNPRPEEISSYAVLDTMILRLTEYFPNAEALVFTGHSAGGQLTNRYAATTPFPDILCTQHEISSKFIIANSGSYLYLDNKRRVNGTIDQFAPPITFCSGYNDWRYGLANLFTYPASFGEDSIKNTLGTREVVYLLGANDNNPQASGLDVSCQAILQGNHRLERGSIYFNYVNFFYGIGVTNLHSLDTVSNVGHDNFLMYTSDIGLFHLFESWPSSCEISTVFISESTNASIQIYPNPAQNFIQVNSLAANASIALINLSGMKILDIQNINDEDFLINIEGLEQGIYIFEYRAENILLRKLIVKNL